MRIARGTCWLVALVGAATLVSACGGASSLPIGGGSSASCAGLTRAQQFKHARVVLTGVMLPGRLVSVANDRQLSSPAQVRVSHYLKGSGPAKVRVQTAVTRSGSGYSFAEDGIQPLPGQHWMIYSSSTHMPYATSVCGGSRALRIR